MGRLFYQFGVVCDRGYYRSIYGQSLLAFVLVLIGGSPVGDPLIRLHPYVASTAHVHASLERLVQGGKMSESFLVVALIRAIEAVLEDCALEVAPPPADWSPATRRLIAQGILLELPGGGLALVGEGETPSSDPERLVRVDLERWRELTAEILADQNLEDAILEEAIREEGEEE